MVYFVPGIIANSRQTRNLMQVWVINICLGWTFLGWVVALVMACSPVVHEQQVEVVSRGAEVP